MFDTSALRQALNTLGELLSEREEAFEIVVNGGGGLLLLGIIQRPTKDLFALKPTEEVA